MAEAPRRSHVAAKIRCRLSSSLSLGAMVSELPKPPQSPVPHLLTSNKTPTDDEKELIRNAILDAEVRIAQLEEDEAAAPNGLPNPKKLHKLRLACEDFARTHKALLLPVRNLPLELLDEIFLQYAYMPSGYHRWVQLPFVLGQVCHSWREVALSLPKLWDTLPCFKLKMWWTRRSSFTTFLAQLLERSGKSPTLKVYIYAPFKEIEEHPVIDVLARHSERFQSLKVESGLTTMIALKAIKGRLPNLQKLELSFWSYARTGELNVFEVAPRLENVSLLGRCPEQLQLPWAQITTYREKYDAEGVAKVLQLSTHLTSLEVVKNLHHAVPLIPQSTMHVLTNLRIRIEDDSPEGDMFFCNFVLPAIQGIKIIYPGPLVQRLTLIFSGSQTPCTLQKLAFRTSTIVPERLTTLLRLIPTLVELDVEVADGDGAFLSIFVNTTSNPVVPLLERLYITARSIAGLEDTLNIVARRRCEREPFKTLRVNLAGREYRYNAQAALNRWRIPASKKQLKDVAQLKTWRNQLLDFLPELFEEYPPLEPRAKDPKFNAKLGRLLMKVEEFVLADAMVLRASKIHLTLSDISKAPPNHIPGDNNRCVALTGEIMTKWKPVLLHYLPEYHWVLKGISSLVYVPSNDPLRKSDNAIQDMVYGWKDELQPADVWWPQHL